MKTEFVQVSRADFFAAIGRLDVHPRPERDRSDWRLRTGEIVGRSSPGYMCDGVPGYWLAPRLLRAGGAR